MRYKSLFRGIYIYHYTGVYIYKYHYTGVYIYHYTGVTLNKARALYLVRVSVTCEIHVQN